MTVGGVPYVVAWAFWALALALNGWLLLRVNRSREIGRVIRWGIVAMISAAALLLAITILLWELGARPTTAVGAVLISSFFSVVVCAMTNIGCAFFASAITIVRTFHEQHNVSKLHRFPISILVDHGAALDRVARIIWLLGSALMFYGTWFDMRG